MIYLSKYGSKQSNSTFGFKIAISPPPEGYEVDLYLKDAYPSKAMFNTVDEKAYRQKYFRIVNPNLYKIRDLLRALSTYGNVYLLMNSGDRHGEILAEKLNKLNVFIVGLRP